jgi:hypothetical protein
VKAELIDRIYESAFVPELWPDVLNELAQPGCTRQAEVVSLLANVTLDRRVTQN